MLWPHLKDRLKRALLEDVEIDDCLDVDVARRARWIVWVSVFVSITILLVAEVMADYGKNSADLFWILFTGIFKSVVHTVYLYLVMWSLIISKAPNQIYHQKLYYPFFLIVSYIAYFAYSYITYLNIYPPSYPSILATIVTVFNINMILAPKVCLLISYSLLLLMYVMWFFRDCFELIETHDYNREWQIVFWLVIEGVSSVILVLRIIYELWRFSFGLKEEWYLLVVNKSTVMLLCLALWAFLRFFESSWNKAKFRCIYSLYLSRNVIENYDTLKISSIPCDKINTILDFGCGGGQRLLQLLHWLGIDKNNLSCNFKIIGFDRDESWKNTYMEVLHAQGFTCEFYTDYQKILDEEFDLVLCSHVLYDSSAAKKLVRIIQSLKRIPGKEIYFVIRGTSYNSFFTGVSCANSWRIWNPTTSHFWLFNLNKVVEKLNLSRIDVTKNRLFRRMPPDPDLTISQRYLFDDVSIDNAVDLLQHLYGGSVGERTKDYFESLKHKSGVPISHLSNDDQLFLYILKG